MQTSARPKTRPRPRAAAPAPAQDAQSVIRAFFALLAQLNGAAGHIAQEKP